MTIADIARSSEPAADRMGPIARRLLLPLFAATIFLSALLLFAVQPLFTKMVIPSLGGTPAVWSVAMVFFQAVLLAGYGWAHLLDRMLPTATAAAVHLLVMALALATTLPIAFDAAAHAPPADTPALWLIGVFLACVGLPFFAVSANGPLLQAWFSRSGHAHAADPYFLYGASNLGSFLALLAYPLVIEPALALRGQSVMWANGFVVLAAGIGLCAAAALAHRRSVGATAGATTDAAPSASATAKVSANDRLAWIGLALVPSALLVAATAHISTDVASVPLLWVVPLALFLLTFVLAFRNGTDRVHNILIAIQPALFAVLAIFMVIGAAVPLVVKALVHLAFFFTATMICHGELFRRRPDAQHLTEFYFFMSLGGVIGGILTSLVAPVAFNSILEYPLVVLAALACRPDATRALAALGRLRAVAGIAIAVALLVVLDALRINLSGRAFDVTFSLLFFAALASLLLRTRPVALLIMATFIMALISLVGSGVGLVERTRSFFAVHVVKQTPDGRGHYLLHGTSVHGAERVRDAAGTWLTSRPEPASYFHPGGPYAQAVDSVRAAKGGTIGRVAVIGLGMGSLSCHASPGEDWWFFEIDPEVVRIARDTRLFRSLSVCTPGAPVVIGDGRLTLAATEGKFDLIVLDAFSSNSVPVHLLTAEAIALYTSKLTDTGVLVFNISNRHMKLEGVVADVAASNGLVMRHKPDNSDTGRFAETLKTAAQVAFAARELTHVGPIGTDPTWRSVPADADRRTWTDDYSNILAPILAKLRK